jgi:hypothetical protein
MVITMRGGSPEDVEVATTILRHIVEMQAPEPLDPGSIITVSDERRAIDPASLTVTITYGPKDDTLAGLNEALNLDRRLQIRDRAIQTAKERIQAARAGGASLHMRDFRVQDMLPFIQHAPTAINAWIEGMEEGTSDFQRRVRRSEGFFIALTEALLQCDPARGETLWLGVRDALVTTYVGAAEVDAMTHMAFRVDNAPDSLRQRILAQATTDQALLEVVIAAAMHGRGEWLSAAAAADSSCGVTWRLQRSRKIRAFDPGLTSEVPEWPVGQGESLRVSRERAVESWTRREAFARYWWDSYWSAPSEDLAYAAWVLLLKSVDRRGHVWMRLPDDAASFTPGRLAHFRVNRNELYKAMKTHEKNLDREFLGRRITAAIGPWRTAASHE